MPFKQIRLLFLITAAFLQKEKTLILYSSIAGIVFFLLIIKVFPYIPRPKPTERMGMIGNYTFENLPISILNLASSGLTKIGLDGKPAPSLAGKWTIEEEGKVYSFLLAENIFWQDGSQVTAEDIKYDLPEVESKVVDRRVLQFTLKELFSPFPTLLATPVFKENFIGTGKYQIKKVEKNGPFVKKILLVGPDKNITFSFYPTSKTAFSAFKLGEFDQFLNLTENPFDKNWQDYMTVEREINKEQYIGIFLNLRDKNLANKNLRQALAYATPKPEGETRAVGPINPNSWAFNSDVKSYRSDASQAKKLFAKFLKESSEEKIKLRIDTTDTLLSLAEEIKKSWQDVLNIETEVKLVDRVPSDFQALLITSQIPADPDQYTFWHSTQESNLTGYRSPKADKILEDARRITEIEMRKEKYLDFQKFLLEDSPVIFISHPYVFNIKKNKVFTF